MFKKSFFLGAVALCAVFLTLTSCQDGYVGPNADQITTSVLDKQKAESLAAMFAASFRDYPGYKAESPIQAWGQKDAAYSFTVNTATKDRDVSVTLPSSYDCDIAWKKTTSDAAFVLNGTLSVGIAASTTNKTETLSFTITDTAIKKSITGTLIITAKEDVDTVGIAAVQRDFEECFVMDDVDFIKTTPISAWGSAAEYGIKYPSYAQSIELHLPDTLLSGAAVIWKQKSNDMQGDGLTVSSGYYFKGQNTNTTTDKKAVLDFQIVNDNGKILTGTLTITASKYDAAAIAARQLTSALSSLKSTFSKELSAISLSRAATIKDLWIDVPITTWGQADAKYSLKAKANRPEGNTFYFPASFSSGTIVWEVAVLGTGDSDYTFGPSDYDGKPTATLAINATVAAGKEVILRFTATYDAAHKVEGRVVITTY